MKYSIITINYNNRDGLRRTIESVVNQTCQDFEYIIIKQPTAMELKELNLNNQHKIILDYSLNIPILGDYKNQKKRIQICNTNSCRLQTDEFDQIII